jgi:hypothetical protein
MEPALNATFDCAYAGSWHEEMRRAVDQRNALPPAACDALVRLLERFLAEDEVVGDAHLDEVRRTIALLSEPTDSRERPPSVWVCGGMRSPGRPRSWWTRTTLNQRGTF